MFVTPHRQNSLAQAEIQDGLDDVLHDVNAERWVVDEHVEESWSKLVDDEVHGYVDGEENDKTWKDLRDGDVVAVQLVDIEDFPPWGLTSDETKHEEMHGGNLRDGGLA
jgi:hypothetical protein